MSRRRHRYPTEEEYRAIEGRRLLERLGEVRREITRSRRPLNSATYDRTEAILDAIDGFAEVIVDDRQHFRLKPNTSIVDWQGSGAARSTEEPPQEQD